MSERQSSEFAKQSNTADCVGEIDQTGFTAVPSLGNSAFVFALREKKLMQKLIRKQLNQHLSSSVCERDWLIAEINGTHSHWSRLFEMKSYKIAATVENNNSGGEISTALLLQRNLIESSFFYFIRFYVRNAFVNSQQKMKIKSRFNTNTHIFCAFLSVLDTLSDRTLTDQVIRSSESWNQTTVLKIEMCQQIKV